MFPLNLNFLILCVITFLTCINQSNAESHLSIFDSSVLWEDIKHKNELLQTVPKWEFKVIESLFNLYKNSKEIVFEKDKLVKYNVQFINTYWGPIDNPFNKYLRPAKLFVFFDEASNHRMHVPIKFYLVPLIRDENDNNYYIFDHNQMRPLLLDEWINKIKTEHNNTKIRFNICNSYANSPKDICEQASYQDEVAYFSPQQQAWLNRSYPAALKNSLSAYRPMQEDWRNKMKASSLKSAHKYDEGVSWENEAIRNELLKKVTTWPNYKIIQENFQKIRDLRYFADSDYPNFLRRISWLYPDDGCWTRAAAVVRDLFGPINNQINYFPRPSKIFAFGNLCVNTSNTVNGSATWWYHTAPIIRDAVTNKTYVLDPSINPFNPLTVEQWMIEISSNAKACKNSDSYVSTFKICNGYGVSPFDECENPLLESIETEADAVLSQPYYQHYERLRQTRLGRDANKILGDEPLWLMDRKLMFV